MYHADGKQGVVFTSGVTDYTGEVAADVLGGGKNANIDSPLMVQGTNDSWFKMGSAENVAIARANLVDGTHYRVVLGFTAGSDHGANGIKIQWSLYNVDTKTVVEQKFIQTYNFFTGSNTQVGNKKLADLVGSIVLYGKFGTTCAIDKLYGVFEDTTIENVMNGLNGEQTYTVTFKGADGSELKKVEGVKFGEVVSYDGEIPTPEKTEDALFTYAYAWDKSFAKTTADTVYTLKVKATPKKGISTNNVSVNGESIVLGSGSIGDGANYTKGQNNGGFVKQSYLGLDGNYALDSYIVFDFTGKNMPEIAFFAKSYNDSMYAEGTSKQGIVVVTGITEWNGKATAQVTSDKAAGTVLNYGFPYMIDDAANGGFCQGAFKESKLGRENLVDGTHYRVVMGFTKYNDNALNLKWVLYNIDTKSIVEEGEMHTWNFFTGSDAQVGNMTINDLVGSIVLYGKFGTTCTIDKLHGVESANFEDVVAKYAKA
jgi:hypothetical protein